MQTYTLECNLATRFVVRLFILLIVATSFLPKLAGLITNLLNYETEICYSVICHGFPFKFKPDGATLSTHLGVARFAQNARMVQ
jgi:hypothetical protein